MLISSVLGMMGYKWVKPIGRIAEIIAVAFSAIAGLVIVSDMGRPERLPYVIHVWQDPVSDIVGCNSGDDLYDP